MTVLIALDSFKGSLSARQACDSLAKGILEERPDEKVLCLPIADGGDGLIDCLQDTLIAQGWQLKSVSVIDLSFLTSLTTFFTILSKDSLFDFSATKKPPY